MVCWEASSQEEQPGGGCSDKEDREPEPGPHQQPWKIYLAPILFLKIRNQLKCVIQIF